jgi:hypothetical protein
VKRSIVMGLCFGVVVQVSMGFGVLWPASAYDTVAVTGGAMLRGTVTFHGTAPEPKEFELRRYPDSVFCGALSDGEGHRLLKEVYVGQGGGLKDAVVVVEGVQSGKPFTFTTAQVEANVCQFLPFVTVVSDKRQLTVTNRARYSRLCLRPGGSGYCPASAFAENYRDHRYCASGQRAESVHHAVRHASLYAELGVCDRQPLLCCDRPGRLVFHR